MTEYSIVNLISFLVGLLFVYVGYRIVRRGREDVTLFVMSAVVGIGLIVVALFPGIFRIVADILGLALRARAILVVSILTLFLTLTYMMHMISTLNDKISSLNEEVSLLKVEVEEKRDER